jgi:Nucleotidyl transferase AbiEii toxin, Type IV TA system
VSGSDVGASVRQRLLNQSRRDGRFRNCSSISQWSVSYIDWRSLHSRIDSSLRVRFCSRLGGLPSPGQLSTSISPELDHIAELISTVCGVVTEPDGIEFNRASIEASRIKEDVDYEGVRVKFHAVLAKARVPMQIDIGFGDVVVPDPTKVEYPTLLDFPAPVLQAYPKETVIAEKLEALTALGLLNSRMKDYYDLALLSRMYSFEGEHLIEAIVATFRHRGTKIESEPIGLTDAFYADPARAIQWRAFVRRSRFTEDSGELERLVAAICQFALPVLAAAAGVKPFKARWQPGGPWK